MKRMSRSSQPPSQLRKTSSFIETTNIPNVIETTSQKSSFIETTGQITSFIETTINISSFIETTNQTSSFIETSNKTSSFIETTLDGGHELYGHNDITLEGWPYFTLHGPGYWCIVLGVVLLGLIGNIMVLILMSDKTLSRLSYPIYLKCLAVSDSFTLITKMVEETEIVFPLPSVQNASNASCKILSSFSSLIMMMSPWLVVGLTLDRYVCVRFPLARDRLCTRKKAIVICSCLLLVSVMTVALEVFDAKVTVECSGSEKYYVYYVFLRVVIFSTLPCSIILVFNIMIMYRIQRSMRFRKTFSSNERDSSTRPLVLISILAFVTLMPVFVTESTYHLLNLTKADVKAMLLTEAVWPVLNIIYILNFGQNFYILMASSSNYRKIIGRKLHIKCLIMRQTSGNRSTCDIPSVSGTTGITLSTIN